MASSETIPKPKARRQIGTVHALAAGTVVLILLVLLQGNQLASLQKQVVSLQNQLNTQPTALKVIIISTMTATNAVTDLTVIFRATISGGRQPYIAIWDFGDGESGSTTLPPSSGVPFSDSHTYVAGGSYIAHLTVTDNSGQTVIAVKSFILLPLTVVLSGGVNCQSRGITSAPMSIQFTGNGQTYSASIESPHYYSITLPNGASYNWTVTWSSATLSSGINLWSPTTVSTLNMDCP